MARSRNSSAWLVAWGALVFLGFRRIAPVERALDVLLSPLRLAAELAWPFGLVGRGEVAAAERELARAAHAEAAEGAAALAVLAERANPTDPGLCAARRFVPAEVVGRPNRDECWVALREASGIARGAPVVCGDVFVGRVLELRAGSPPQARVQLVTQEAFRVGARVHGSERPPAPGEPAGVADDVYLTVGGLRVPRGRREPRTVRLAVHQPSASALAGGLARVHELFAEADGFAPLAEGFRLGEVRRDGARGELWIEPELDFLDGLVLLAIVVPAAEGAPPPGPPRPALADGRWCATRALTFGDPSPWRRTLKVPLGRDAGVRAGAAVTGGGARLVGRVTRAGRSASDVALVSDPGFTCVAIARFEPLAPSAGDDEQPHVLGRIASLGPGRDGTIRLRWWVRQPLGSAGAPERRARLFTGSGEPGLPGGLVLGTALLPGAAGAGEVRELELDPGVDLAAVRALFVRCETRGDGP